PWPMLCRSQNRGGHVFNDVIGKFAGADFGCAWHQALEIVSDLFLFDGALEAAFDQVGGFIPAHVSEHHYAREHDGSGIDHLFVGILWRCSMSSFKHRVAVADVGAWSDAQTANLCGACIGKVIAV